MIRSDRLYLNPSRTKAWFARAAYMPQPFERLVLKMPPDSATKQRRSMHFGDDELHRFDAAWPTQGGPFPTILLVHGGAWTLKEINRRMFRSVLRPLAHYAQAVVISTDYRLAPAARWPAQLDDITMLVDKLESNAFPALPVGRPYYALGTSAGGHLVLMGIAKRALFDSVAAFYAPTDLSRAHGAPPEALLGFDPQDNVTEARRASPVGVWTSQTGPALLVHGDADGSVPLNRSLRLQARARKLGAEVDVAILKRAEHGFLRFPKRPWTRDAVVGLSLALGWFELPV